MKQKLSISLAITFLVILTFSSFNQASSISVAQLEPKNTTYETGDYFEFTLNRDEDRDNYWYSSLSNASDPTDLWQYQEEEQQSFLMFSGYLDVDILRDRAILPPDEFGDRIDTIGFSETFAESQPGSQSSGFRNELRFDEFGASSWDNRTFPVQDLSGLVYQDRNDDAENIRSNATYALIFPEMMRDVVDIPFFMPWGLPADSNFTSSVGVNRTVSLESNWLYTINGIPQTLDVRIVESTVFYNYSESFVINIPFGPENNPDTPYVDVNATFSIELNMSTIYVFDQANGAFLENMNDIYYEFGMDLWSNNLTITFPAEGGNPAVTQNFAYDASFGASSTEYDSIVIETASSQYGQTRPVSTGTNRIEEGDLLEYEFENSEWTRFASDVQFSGGPNSFSKNDDRSSWSDGSGIVNIDVFRHSAEGFEAVIFGEGRSDGGFTVFEEEIRNGQRVRFFEDSGDYLFQPFQFGEITQFMNTLDLDISPQFDSTMALPDFFGNDNDNRDCDGPDCGDGDDFIPNLPFEMPTDGLLNDTIIVVPPDEDDNGVVQDGATLTINGFDYLFYEARYVGQDYSFYKESPIQIPIGGEDGEETIWVTGTLTVDAEGSQANIYDIDTGAMLAWLESTEVYVLIEVQTTVQMPDNNGNMVNVQIDIKFELEWQEEFDMTLMTHPSLYQSAQDLSTVTNPNTSDPTTSTTTSTTDDPTSSTGTEESSADLPLPLPFLPIVTGLATFTVILRFRKRS